MILKIEKICRQQFLDKMFCYGHLVDLYEAPFIGKTEIVVFNVYLNCTQIRQNVIKRYNSFR